MLYLQRVVWYKEQALSVAVEQAVSISVLLCDLEVPMLLSELPSSCTMLINKLHLQDDQDERRLSKWLPISVDFWKAYRPKENC